MPEPRTYASAEAFRSALEDRLARIALEQALDINRLRKMVALERLLARLFNSAQPPWILKGGYAMEMRFRQAARATRDIDMSLPELRPLLKGEEISDDKLLAELTRAGAVTMSDWFTFQIGSPSAELEAQPYGGIRFPTTAMLADREFTAFHLDVALGDATASEPEWVQGHDLLGFAGIAPAKIALIPKEQQFAEKVHAYTLPRESANSRVRDLVDLVLLVQKGLPDKAKAIAAVQATFQRRKTHPVPDALPLPPADWEEPYRKIADEIRLQPVDANAAHAIVSEYWKGLKFERGA